MPFPKIPDLPVLLRHHKEHLTECGDCFRIAVRIKDATPKSQLELITRIMEMHGDKSIKPRVLGRDKMIYLKIPERLWDDLIQIASEHKIKLRSYEIKSFIFTKAENLKETSTQLAREKVKTLLLEDEEIAQDLGPVFARYNKGDSNE